jgi:ABC-2 type transport system ATP-binding protein
MCGLLFPDKGNIQLAISNNKHLSIKRDVRIQQNIFFLPEQFELPPISVSSFIGMESVFYPNFNHSMLEKLLADLTISDNHHTLNKMSLGQQKKFMIAFGLASQCTYLLLDEPTNGLDIPSKSQFRKILASTFTDKQVIVISTHQIRDLDKLIDAIIILEDGTLLFQSDIERLERKLRFIKAWEKPSAKDIIYTEKVMGGYVSIVPSDGSLLEEVELEILFNALLENKNLVSEILNKEQ